MLLDSILYRMPLLAPDKNGNGGNGKGDDDQDTKPKDENGDDEDEDGDDEGEDDDLGDDEEFDKARALRTIRKQRRENKKQKRDAEKQIGILTRKVEAFEKKESDAAEAEKSDLQKATERAEGAEAERDTLLEHLKDERIKHAIQIAAAQAGFYDPSDAVAGIKFGDLEYDDETGAVSGVEEALEELIEAKPYLVEDADTGEDDDSKNGPKGSPRRKKKEPKGKKKKKPDERGEEEPSPVRPIVRL